MNTTEDIKRVSISPSSKIRDAIAAIDKAAVQIALVTDHNNCLIGTVTDGDVRRALLRGTSLDSPVDEIMNRKFRSLAFNATDAEALALMQRKALHQVPALDPDGRVVKLFLLEELIQPKKLLNTVVVMAGGEGKRLRPLTTDCPKPMLRVSGKPMLEIILQKCTDAGFEEFYFAVNYLKDQIKGYFQDGAQWNARIQYLEETQPLGTAGALTLLPKRPSAPVLVMNGDVLTRVDFVRMLRFHEEHQAAVTLCVNRHDIQIPYGVVHTEDAEVLSLEEKPIVSKYINAGIYLLNPEVLELLSADSPRDMPQLLMRAIEQKLRVVAFPLHEYWLDVGHPETLNQAHGEWA